MELNFVEKKASVDIGKINEYLNVNEDILIEIVDVDPMRIDYTLLFDLATWGISSIKVHIDDVRMVANWESETSYLNDEEKQQLISAGGEEDGDMIRGEIKITSKEFGVNADLGFESETTMGYGSFSIKEVYVNLKEKEIYLS